LYASTESFQLSELLAIRFQAYSALLMLKPLALQLSAKSHSGHSNEKPKKLERDSLIAESYQIFSKKTSGVQQKPSRKSLKADS
jgi:hypothetical protein